MADQLGVREDLAKAVAAVLADRWQDVLVASIDDGIRLVEKLRNDKKGRAAVMADGSRARASSTPSHPPREGVRGMLFAMVGGESEVPEALWDALRPVVLVDSLSAARDAWQVMSSSDVRYRYVTPDGQVFDADGRVVGGVPEAAGAGLLATHAEIARSSPGSRRSTGWSKSSPRRSMRARARSSRPRPSTLRRPTSTRRTSPWSPWSATRGPTRPRARRATSVTPPSRASSKSATA